MKKLEIAAKEISQLKADKAKLEKTQQENGERIKVLEHDNSKRDTVIRNLTKEFVAATELTEMKNFNAVIGAKHEFTNRFQAKFSRARGCFEKMTGEALENMVDLSEMVSNLQLIYLLQSDKAPTLDAEAKNIAEHIEGLDGADKRFEQILSDLDKALTLEPVDDLAASVGVAEPSGANHDAPRITEFVSKELLENPTPTKAIEDEPSVTKVDLTAKGAKDSSEETLEEFLEAAAKENAGGTMVIDDGEFVYDDETKETMKADVTKEEEDRYH